MAKSARPGAGQRQLRVGEELRHALVAILARGELHDPELAEHVITVTEVRVSPDLRTATVFVTPLAAAADAALLRALSRAAPFLRGRLAQAVDLRFAPNLRFAADQRFEQAEKIARLLDSDAVARDLGPGADSEG